MTTDELLESAQTLMDKPETDEEYLNINWETRVITLPSGLTNIGVYNDKDTNRLYFRCPLKYGEFSVADFGLHVNYMNTGHDGDVYFVDDAKVDGDYITFSWLVGRHAYLQQGTTRFIVCCKIVDGDNNVVNELNTTIASLTVLEGLEVDVAPPEDYPDYLEELLKRVDAVEESALTGVKVNGEEAPITDHVAEITVKGESAIEHIKVNGTEQSIEDKTVDIEVPTKVSELDNDAGYVDSDALDEVKQTADSAQETAKKVKDYADEQVANLNDRVNSKVSSVNIGTVTTGDEPSVTNSGTDKDVVMDFVFPSGGDSPIISGTIPEEGEIKISVSNAIGIFTEPAGYGAPVLDLMVFGNNGAYGRPDISTEHDISIESGTEYFAIRCGNGVEVTYLIIGATLVD